MFKQDQKVSFDYFGGLKGVGRVYGVVKELPVLGTIYIVLIEEASHFVEYKCIALPEIVLTLAQEEEQQTQPKDTDAVLGGK